VSSQALKTTPNAAALETSIEQGLRWMLGRQDGQGYWVGRLQTNSSMEAEWTLALHFMGLSEHPLRPRLVRAILNEQRPDGAWQVYHGSPAGDVNATVECYAALRSAGMDKDTEPMRRARAWILERDALQNIRVFTRYWLALIGEWPWEQTPNVPPEVIYFPGWFPFSIYNFACWARATLMAITILSARRPVRPLPAARRLDELFPNGRDSFDYSLPRKTYADRWERFFLLADRLLHGAQRFGLMPLRERAVRQVLEWIVDHQDADGVWGGIQPPWIYSLMALHVENYSHEHPIMAKGLGALDDPRWQHVDGEATYIQACVSPVWDTILGILAFQDCEADEQHTEQMNRAFNWVLSQQVRTGGDWQVKVPDVEPGGWAFEYENASYPDVDDTAVVLIVLAELRDKPEWQAKGIEEAIERAIKWVLAMQCKGGGWGAFDKDNDKSILTKIPFCDFGEALDPPSVDVTAHVLDALGRLGYRRDHLAVARGLAFLKAEQEADGSWFGRWGVNYVYGTASVLPALKEIGENMRADYVLKAADWIKSHQQDDGGWGESCASYMDSNMSGRGTTTASQTAWALMSLLAVDRPEDRSTIERGTAFLVAKQKDGTWDEPEHTGTGFPGYGVGLRTKLVDPRLEERLKQGPELSRAFMINYNMYRHYFPLMAMGRARAAFARQLNAPLI
jgi:squalene-hopene/tetraprenyl-beta-curcumene cyclase